MNYHSDEKKEEAFRELEALAWALAIFLAVFPRVMAWL